MVEGLTMRRMSWRHRLLPLCRDEHGTWFWKFPYGWLDEFNLRDLRGTYYGAREWIRVGLLSGRY